jgi:GNAT superfamily N-acetyltransferase
MLSPTRDARLLVDELAARAWPAAATSQLGGWTLRHTPQVARRRSNSALPTPGSVPADLTATLDVVVRFYQARGLPPHIQLTPLELHGELDAALGARGWVAATPTVVLAAAAADVLVATGPAPRATVALEADSGTAWLDAWSACTGRPDARATQRVVFGRIAAPTAWAVARIEDEPVGAGLAVCEGGWAGIFGMATQPSARRRGVARSLLHAFADWSATQGATQLYLQVEEDNMPARTLYASAGFAPSHRYHFRVAPDGA